MTRNHLLFGTLLLAGFFAAGTGFGQGVTRPAHATATAPELEIGDSITTQLSEEDGQNYKDGSRVKLFSFRAEEGDTVHIHVGSDDFDTFLTLFAPDGLVLDWNDDDWEADFSDYVWNSTLRHQVAETGRYTIAVSGYSAEDYGSFELGLAAGTPPAVLDFDHALPLGYPGETAVEIGSDMPATGSGFTGPGQPFSFEVEEELLFVIHSSSETLDPVLVLYDGDGNLLAVNDDYPVHGEYVLDALISVELAPGTYHLVAGTYAESWESEPQELTVSVKTYRSVD